MLGPDHPASGETRGRNLGRKEKAEGMVCVLLFPKPLPRHPRSGLVAFSDISSSPSSQSGKHTQGGHFRARVVFSHPVGMACGSRTAPGPAPQLSPPLLRGQDACWSCYLKNRDGL